MLIHSRKAGSSAYTHHVESLRSDWVTRVHRAVVRLLDSYREGHGANAHLIAARIEADRDTWETLITQTILDAGKVFAAQPVAALAQRARVKDFSADSPSYAASYVGFMRTYLGGYARTQADRVLAALVARLHGLVAHASKARMPARPSAAPGAAFNDTSADDNGDGDTDGEDDGADGGVTAPDFDELLDGIFDGAALVLAGLVVLLASNLGPLAGANAFADDQDIELVKTWTAIIDKETRPDHADANGQERALDEPFDVGDSQLMFPGDESLGADFGEIIYCRCVVDFDVSASKRRALRLDWADRIVGVVLEGVSNHA